MTGAVKAVDGGDGTQAGVRVASDVRDGLPKLVPSVPVFLAGVSACIMLIARAQAILGVREFLVIAIIHEKAKGFCGGPGGLVSVWKCDILVYCIFFVIPL